MLVRLGKESLFPANCLSLLRCFNGYQENCAGFRTAKAGERGVILRWNSSQSGGKEVKKAS